MENTFELRKLFIPIAFCYPSFFKNFPDGNFEIVSNIGRLENLFENEQKNNTKIHSLRNKANVEWRYKNPLIKYEILAYKSDSGSEAEGYISYYVNRNKLFIFDFVFTTSNSRKALINNLKNQVIRKNLSGIIGFCQKKSIEERQLKKSGFLINSLGKGPLSEKTQFVIYSDKETMNEFDSPDFWAVKSYDHDSY